MAIDGGWHVPEDNQAGDLLAGVDATIYPQPEPAPLDEVTDTSPAPAEAGEDSEPLLVDDQPSAPTRRGPGYRGRARDLPGRGGRGGGDGRQLEREQEDAPGENPRHAGRSRAAVDLAAAIAAARAAELAGEAESGLLTETSLPRLPSDLAVGRAGGPVRPRGRRGRRPAAALPARRNHPRPTPGGAAQPDAARRAGRVVDGRRRVGRVVSLRERRLGARRTAAPDPRRTAGHGRHAGRGIRGHAGQLHFPA